MRLLLDTHSFLWFISGSTSLSPTARALIEDASNQPLLSVASLWEMAIKLSLGKLSLAQPFEVLIPQQMRLNGIKLLGIEIEHTAAVSKLPFHHRDPFDRLLIAQAIVEQMPIVSADTAFDTYPVKRLW
ncbi:MAG: type II toxin-antitoxin system VapC family toxin [Anaerolineales bacterium]|nr:MAG: type II toxin-antitoxin system VapC family toxin [Anaerolineales bacterium]